MGVLSKINSGVCSIAQQVQTTGCAFAALKDLKEGWVVTWASPKGESGSAVQVQTAFNAFAAIPADGSVIYSSAQDQLRSVRHIQTALGAFAAILEDGSIVTSGKSTLGGDSSGVQDQIANLHYGKPAPSLRLLACGCVCWKDDVLLESLRKKMKKDDP